MPVVRICFLGLTILVACAQHSDSLALVDSAPPNRDALEGACTEQAELTIGQCIDLATALPCLDFGSIQREFVPLAQESAVPQIVGLQGSPMFVFAIRVADLEVSPDERNPLVQIEVSLGPNFVGGYTARPDFVDAHQVAPQLYVVTLLDDDATGQQADIFAKVTTATSERCANASFEIGGLVDDPG